MSAAQISCVCLPPLRAGAGLPSMLLWVCGFTAFSCFSREGLSSGAKPQVSQMSGVPPLPSPRLSSPLLRTPHLSSLLHSSAVSVSSSPFHCVTQHSSSTMASTQEMALSLLRSLSLSVWCPSRKACTYVCVCMSVCVWMTKRERDRERDSFLVGD